MAYEYPTRGGILRLHQAGCRWAIEFDGSRRVHWATPDDAVMAAVHHRTGLAGWDQLHLIVPDELLRWRPIGDNL